MNFFNKLREIFFINNSIVKEIININDIVQIPNRDYFSDNKEMMHLINKYKLEYLDILTNKNILFSKELNIDNLHNEIKMDIDLLLNICIRDDEVFENNEDIDMKNINREIQMIKLNLYLNSFYRLEEETLARIISLKEIIDDCRRLYRKNRNAIDSEVNNLSLIIIIFRNQKVAIRREIDSYLKEMELYKDNIDLDLLDREELLENKLNELVDMAKRFIPNILSNIEKMECSNLLKVAYIEKEIEKYVYMNKNILDNLFNELKLLDDEPKDISNKGRLLKLVNELEYKFNLFYKYGRKILTDDDMYNLYRVKFDILTIDICGKNFILSSFKGIRDKNNYEYECYKEIVRKKIEKIFRGENEVIKEVFGSDSVKAIKNIKNSLNYKYGLDNILNYYLDYILSFDKVDGFNEYLLKKKTSRYNRNFLVKVTWCSFVSDWDWELPFNTFFFLYSLYKGISKVLDLSSFEISLFNLYNLMEKHKEETDEYRIPEGAVYLDCISYEDYNPLARELSIRSDGKKVICPDSLRRISFNDLFCVKEVLDIELNQGLEEVSLGIDIKSREIAIPSSVWKITKIKNIDTIMFEDYEKSEILTNDENLLNLVKELFYYEKIEDTLEFVSNDLVKVNRGDFFQANYFDIYKYKIKIKPRFERLILLDRKGYGVIYINACKVTFILNRTTYDDMEYGHKLTLDNLNMIVNEIRRIIERQEWKNLNSIVVKKRYR